MGVHRRLHLAEIGVLEHHDVHEVVRKFGCADVDGEARSQLDRERLDIENHHPIGDRDALDLLVIEHGDERCVGRAIRFAPELLDIGRG